MAHGDLPPRDTLTVREFAALEVFYKAQRPHDKPKTWRQLRKMGFKPIAPERVDMEYIKSTCTELNNPV